jgi:phosphoribosylanthranilate isomerase
MRPLFRVKVCGLTRISDLEILARAGVDAVGINLVPTSPRYAVPALAQQLAHEAQRLGLQTVAVTMDLVEQELLAWQEMGCFDWLQLHGDELPEIVSRLDDRKVVKSLAWSGRHEEVTLALEWRDSVKLAAFLVDAYAPGVGGGTGRTARWDLLFPRPECLSGIPLVLAGGLTAENVGLAIITTRCTGVDTASGVETSPGLKDADKVKRFAQAALTALG